MALIANFRPVVLIRGFDPLGDTATTTYYGFNDGTVYPHKMGDDYIYEGMLLKFLKTGFRYPVTAEDGTVTVQGPVFYQDATNALRYEAYDPDDPLGQSAVLDPTGLASLNRLLDGQNVSPETNPQDWLRGPVVLDPEVAARFKNVPNSIWVFRYYDFKKRDVVFDAQQLQKVIAIIEAVTGVSGVHLICHSMGGLVARYLIQELYGDEAERHVLRWVTLGTPHRGIAFDGVPQLGFWELAFFNVLNLQTVFGAGYDAVPEGFDADRVLCVVGTNWRTYAVKVASALNQLASWLQGQDQSKSDGLVKQLSATLKGAHKAFVLKCHGGEDSLVTSREAFELASRFFFGDVRATVKLLSAAINPARAQGFLALAGALGDTRNYSVGFSVKARQTDFYLNRMDGDSENCFGPFNGPQLTSADIQWDPTDASRNGTVFEGFFNSALARVDPGAAVEDLVFRFDTFVNQRDAYLLGHSDTVLVSQQSYFQVVLVPGEPFELVFYARLDDTAPVPCVRQGTADVFLLELSFDPQAGSFFHPSFQMSLEISLNFSH